MLHVRREQGSKLSSGGFELTPNPRCRPASRPTRGKRLNNRDVNYTGLPKSSEDTGSSTRRARSEDEDPHVSEKERGVATKGKQKAIEKPQKERAKTSAWEFHLSSLSFGNGKSSWY